IPVNCEACNDVVKKPKLDAHKSRCRNAVFTCIDCSTTFNGTDYRSHTSCISEDQKYQGALYR
ncbi:LYAR-type C2HC zinc finger-domain-containing protein, partial [Trichophaea hybrida]